jgi:hypothetical protein
MRLRPVHLVLSGLLLLAPLAACGKSDDSSSSGNTSSTIASGTTGASGGSSSNDAVRKYCDDVHAYADQVASAIEKKDYNGAEQISKDAQQRLQDEARAAAAEAQAHPRASYLKCQEDSRAAAERIATAMQRAYGSYAP